MSLSLYDDEVLDGVPLMDKDTISSSTSAPLVGLRVAATWSESESEIPSVYGSGVSNANSKTSLKFMQSHMAAKRAQSRRDNSATNWCSKPTVAPVVDLNQRNSAEGSFRFNQQTGRLERSYAISVSRPVVLSSPAMSAAGLLFSEPFLPLGVADEYNPLCPNDFEELARIKRERRRAEIQESTGFPGGRSDSTEVSGLCRRPDFSDEEMDDEDEPTAASGKRRRTSTTSSRGAAIAPPSALLEDSTPNIVESSDTTIDNDESEMIGPANKFGINLVAAKMMARMGYREGQGLGREGQGMSTALVVEKTSRHGGKIIHERDHQRQKHSATISMPLNDAIVEETFNNLPLPENRSCVILLRNMCGSGEVDDDLEPETAEECAKYGKVVTCMIFELPDAADDEAVRIFVEFENEEGATQG